jgi:hypothetical protein
MRNFIISIATLGALISFAGTSVTALTQAQFAGTTTSAHHQMKVNNAVRTVHPAHAPLLAS